MTIPEPTKSGLEKVVFLFELEFFFYFEIEKTVVIVHVFLFRNGKKILAQMEKPLFLVQIYQAHV